MSISLTPCVLVAYDFAVVSSDRPRAAVAAWLTGMNLAALSRLDLRYWNTGQVVSPQDAPRGLDFQEIQFRIGGTTGLNIEYTFVSLPSTPLVGAKVGGIFDLPNRSGGFKNFYTGEIEWDWGFFAEWRGPNAWAVVGGEYTREREIPGATARQSGNTLSVTVPLDAVQNAGLATPGVFMKFGAYTRMPDSVYDAFPERGGIQLGFAGQVSPRTLVQVDANNDRRNDLWYLSVTGADAVEAIADDKNNNGRIDFLNMEGPVAFRVEGTYMPFARPQVTTQGRAAIIRVDNPNLVYGLRKEDRNGDGDLTDEGETEGALFPVTTGFWKF